MLSGLKEKGSRENKIVLVLAGLLLLELALSLCLTTSGEGFRFNLDTVKQNSNPILVTCLNGGILAVSGAVFQTVFRNPLAAPSILGASTGVNIGLLVLVLQFQTNALLMVRERYLYTYGCAMLVVFLIMLSGKLVGKSNISVSDMLLVGAVISQIMNAVMMFYRFNMSLEIQEVLQNFTLGRLTTLSGDSFKLFCILVTVGIVPIVLLRFRINILSFGDEEAKSLGINPTIIRIILLMSATLLYTASIIHCGSIGMISLVVPFMARMLMGADFRYLFYACSLLGAVLLLLCRDVQTIITPISGFIPVTVFVSVLGTPVFVIMLLKQRRYAV